jgi:hypothetical protein
MEMLAILKTLRRDKRELCVAYIRAGTFGKTEG